VSDLLIFRGRQRQRHPNRNFGRNGGFYERLAMYHQRSPEEDCLSVPYRHGNPVFVDVFPLEIYHLTLSLQPKWLSEGRKRNQPEPLEPGPPRRSTDDEKVNHPPSFFKLTLRESFTSIPYLSFDNMYGTIILQVTRLWLLSEKSIYSVR
jgi:hypothetical protein